MASRHHPGYRASSLFLRTTSAFACRARSDLWCLSVVIALTSGSVRRPCLKKQSTTSPATLENVLLAWEWNCGPLVLTSTSNGSNCVTTSSTNASSSRHTEWEGGGAGDYTVVVPSS